MDTITYNPQLIAACGLYCGACRKFLKGKCPGCIPGLGQPLSKGLQRCKIRKCCLEKGFHTCAECDKDVKECRIYNNLVGKLFAFLFNSDRAACIHSIKKHGEEAFSMSMADKKQMTIKKR